MHEQVSKRAYKLTFNFTDKEICSEFDQSLLALHPHLKNKVQMVDEL